MKLFTVILCSLILPAVDAFCIFGFMATFEPTDRTTGYMAFRLGYCVIGVGCLIGAGIAAARAFRDRDDRSS